MAPRGKRTAGGSSSVESSEPQAFHELGVRGRKTGAFLRDTGERDEHGMQPLDAIFSSPHHRDEHEHDHDHEHNHEHNHGHNHGHNHNDGDGDGSEDMDISYSGGPGPRTVLKNQRTMQNTHAAGHSSPHQDSNDDTTVSRKLNFNGRGSGDGSIKSKANGKAKAASKGAGLNGHSSFGRQGTDDIDAIMVGTKEDDLVLDPREVATARKERKEAKGPGARHEEPEAQSQSQSPAHAKKPRGRPPKSSSKPAPAPSRAAATAAAAAAAPKAMPKPTSKPVTKAPTKIESKAAPKAGSRPVGRPAKVPSPEPSPEPEEPEAPEEMEAMEGKDQDREGEGELEEIDQEVVEEEEEEDEEDEGVDEEEEEEEAVGVEDEQEVEQEPAKKKRGRPAKDSRPHRDHPAPSIPTKKRRSIEKDSVMPSAPSQPDPDEDTPRKKQRTEAPPVSKPESLKPKGPGRPKSATAPMRAPAPVPTATAKPGARGRPGRPPKSAAGQGAESRVDGGEDAETSFAGLQRGPPMPKSRGLVSVRRDNTITQTRSGRHSYRPVDYWRGEQIIQEVEEQDDMFNNRKTGFLVPSRIKEIVRVPLEAPPSKKSKGAGASRSKARTKAKKAAAEPEEEEEEELEEWEVSPGVVEGEIVIWETEHEEHPPADDEAVQVTDERIAISASAIQTSDIRDATFRFAKTLTMPFMGAGVVDLPPGGEKRPKNSRKMHMVFFVHTGKVMVTINEAQFRISAGGMWFVPRGNYYSITNDYDRPSRVFFCQACEISASFADTTQQSMA